jgi:mannosyl-oligosaccharide alpha-1,2-mannosidase
MGLSSEYDLCRPHVNQLDLRLINGRDWERGSRVFFPDGTVEYEARKGRDSTALVGTFETGIRYLGGLIGAYDLSGDELMLERAEDLARLLCKGFETSTGLLMGKFDAGRLVPALCRPVIVQTRATPDRRVTRRAVKRPFIRSAECHLQKSDR